ncbi:EAL domain-containing protein [bacterium]|nr:EAL domain-containing protein [bacterium]MBU1994853.1 EAL domain-containing protein [bacterium]
MLNTMHSYSFIHKQLLVLIALFVGTGPGFVYMGWFHSSYFLELSWYLLLLIVSLFGYKIHREYSHYHLSIHEKKLWIYKLNYFLYSYFSLWTIMFIIYTSKDSIELHYIAIATQLGSSVVAATILASQKKLAIITVVSLMLPLTIYFFLIHELYAYLLAFFTIVLSGVLLYASNNTYNYLAKSKFQAYHDYLTKLGNRRYFIELLEDSIKNNDNGKKYTYLLLIDLDHFKTINDTLGHDIGDMLLCEVAARMQNVSKKHHNFVSRLGGDEFCILSSYFATKEECLHAAVTFSQQLLNIIKESYIVQGHHLYISASIGVSIVNKPKMKAGIFIKEADIAMYEAKSQGRDGVILFNDELSHKVEYKLEIERLLHFALEKNEISLKYQMQVDAHDEIIGCEVLARWHSSELGNVPPDEFILIAEHTGLIVEIGYFILEESFKTLKSWNEKGIHLKQLSINISMRQVFHNTFIDDVKKLSSKYLNKDLCSKLVFEMTETSAAEDIKRLVSNMYLLENLGIRFSMDDFGTGYSSLSYLRQIPLHELKIDKSFIGELKDSEQGRKMVKTILDIAKNLNLTIVAEGVEELYQKEFLLEQQCDILQGYYFSKPINKDEFEKVYLASKKS